MVTLMNAHDLRISVVDNEIIRNYVKRIESGEQLAPVVIKGGVYMAPARIKDGNHRAAAYKLLNMAVPTIPE